MSGLRELVQNGYFVSGAVILLIILFGLSFFKPNHRNNIPKIMADEKSDKNSLKRLLIEINRHGNIQDPNTLKPLVVLENFFVGNNDYGSIGYHFYPHQPSPREFYEHFRNIRQKTEVYKVLVEIKDQVGTENWPSTDIIWIITSATEDDVRNWLGVRFQADDLLIGFPDKIRLDEIRIPTCMKAIGVWWK